MALIRAMLRRPRLDTCNAVAVIRTGADISACIKATLRTPFIHTRAVGLETACLILLAGLGPH
jgi:hypothetical protein